MVEKQLMIEARELLDRLDKLACQTEGGLNSRLGGLWVSAYARLERRTKLFHEAKAQSVPDGWTKVEGGFELLPLVDDRELLRVGMSGGRALIEQPKKRPAKKDDQTLDLFGQKPLF